MVDTPGLIQRSKDVPSHNTVADEADVSKQLVIMSFTVCETFLLVVTSSKERFLTLGADKVLDMIGLAKCVDNSLLNWTPARSADGYSHFVVTAKAVELSTFLSGICIQLNAAGRAVEVVWMIGFSFVLDHTFLNY